MKNAFLFTPLCLLIISACSITTKKPKEPLYRAQQFTGQWVVINGPLKGAEYEATLDGDEIVVVGTADSECVAAGTVVFVGYVIADKIIGQANFCVGSAPVSSGKMVVMIQDISTLSATIEGYGTLNFPSIILERLIRLSRYQQSGTLETTTSETTEEQTSQRLSAQTSKTNNRQHNALNVNWPLSANSFLK